MYNPGLQDTGDLESATRIISATAEPGSPDYWANLSIAAPADSRLQVKRLGVRLQITVDSWAGGGTTLNYRIKRGGVSINDGTLTVSGDTGALYASCDVTDGTLTGTAEYEVHLWVDTGTCTVSVCRMWAGVGSSGTGFVPCCLISHTGSAYCGVRINLVGSGNPSMYLKYTDNNIVADSFSEGTGHANWFRSLALLKDTVYIFSQGTLNSDVTILVESYFIFKSYS